MRDTTTVFETFYVDVTQANCEQRLADALEEDGLVTFDNIGSQEDLMNLARKLGTIVRHTDLPYPFRAISLPPGEICHSQLRDLWWG